VTPFEAELAVALEVFPDLRDVELAKATPIAVFRLWHQLDLLVQQVNSLQARLDAVNVELP
jgi:hypothetical protein